VENQHLSISVVIPARNSVGTLGDCLRALQASRLLPHEAIVVNDASSDGTMDVARSFGAKVVDLMEHRDANFSRNRGAQEATGDILLFLDSDVLVKPDTLQAVLDTFRSKPVDAVVGVYSTDHPHPELASQYKNLWIRYSYLASPPAVDWVFGAVTAVRRSAFLAVGGYNARLIASHGNDDLELGKRMAESRYSIVLNPTIEVVHLKPYTVRSLLKNDFIRSQAFVRLAGDLQQLHTSLARGFVNVYPRFVHSVPLSVFVVVTALLGFWHSSLVWVAGLGLVAHLWLNAPFLRYFRQHRGTVDALKVWGLMFLDHLVCAAGSMKGFLRWLFRWSSET
jgi:glycosyltransferase involved in cell wall biosynthesis